ncbi:MAG TPA: hypothetical protein VJ183_12115 [Chloroflexia bacterium]|nr:hypothetical protein [Chloroflexia bacterium]
MSNPSPPGQPGTVTCFNCGNVSAAGLPFCAHCGRPLSSTPYPGQQYPPSFSTIAVPAPLAKSGGRSANRLIIGTIIGIGLVALIGVGVLLAFVFGAIQPIMSTGDTFMSSLRDGDYSKAFSLLTPELQKEVVNAQGLAEQLSPKQPASWESRNFKSADYQASANYVVTFKNGEHGGAILSFEKIGNDWKISHFSLN